MEQRGPGERGPRVPGERQRGDLSRRDRDLQRHSAQPVPDLAVDADAFRTADGNLEGTLRIICERVHGYGDVPVGKKGAPVR